MAFNGSGTFLINTAGQPVVSGTVISSTAFNALTADLATGLSTAITKDGQTTVTANIPMSTYKFTGLGVGSAATDSANLSQVQSTVTKLLTSVSGTDTITAVGAPVVAAYAAGQMFYFVATGDNTGAVTLNIDSLGAKAVTRDGSVALAAGDIKSGEVVVVVYDGTRFQVVSQLNSAGNATFANVSITSALNVGGVATFAAGTVAAPSITTTGDTNTGIFFPAADTIGFTEGGVEAARFDSSGNLGIGTSTPGQKLHVVGNIRTTNSLLESTGTSVNFGTITGGFLAFLSGSGAEAGRFDSSGNLGIGTSSPASKLDVVGGTGIRVNEDGAGTKIIQVRSNFAGVGPAINVVTNDPLLFQTNNTERMRLDTSGNLGLGVTPSAWGSGTKAIDLGSGTALWNPGSTTNTALLTNAYHNGTNYIYKATAVATNYLSTAGQHQWFTAPSGTAGNTISFTQAMTLDASGNLGIGTSSPSGKIATQVTASGTFQNAFVASDGTSSDLLVRIRTNETQLMNSGASVLSFGTSNTERARITSGGYSKFSNSGTYSNAALYHEFYQTNNNTALLVRATNATFSDAVVTIQGDRTTTNTSYYLLDSYNGNLSGRFRIADSGNATNTNGSYGTISDAKMKTDIVDAGSQWDDLKAVRFRKFKMKDDPQQITLLGVVAQELEQTSPGLVEEHADRDTEGNDLGTTTKSVKSSILLMKAAVALQEAMARIEQLEAKFAALESK